MRQGADGRDTEQLALFNAKQGRSLESAQRALARVRAALGDVAGVPVVRGFHAPERQFEFAAVSCLQAPLEQLPKRRTRESSDRESEVPRLRLVSEVSATLSGSASGPLLVRRLWAEPRKLARAPQAAAGPYRVASGWGRMSRDYYYVRGEAGELWWVFYDAVSREWFAHGVVD